MEKFKISYKNDQSTKFTKEEVFNLLKLSNIFSDEVSAMFTAIAERESGGYKPGALNTSKESKDFSVGLFQVNLRADAHGLKNIALIWPTKEKVLGLKLVYSLDPNLTQEELKYKVLNEADRSTMDQRAFIPYNQVSLLAAVAVGETKAADAVLKGRTIDGYLFYHWGDYKNKFPTTSQYYSVVGTIAEVKYSTVRDLYISTGKNEQTLKSWIRKNFKGQVGEPYIEKWMQGTIFSNSGAEEQDENF